MVSNVDVRYPMGPMGSLHERHQNIPASRPLTSEEIQEWNNCLKSGIFKGGLPFACGMYIINSLLKKDVKTVPVSPTAPAFNLKPKFLFVANIFVGIFLYSPICYNRLLSKYIDTNKRLRENEEGVPSIKSEKGISQTDDGGFHSSLDLNLDVSENSFSHLDMDVDSSASDKLILEDPQDAKQKKSIPDTTYDDLRKRNRENFSRKPTYPTPYARDEPRPSGYLGPVAQKPPTNEPLTSKPVKNKYGDEVEI